MSDTAQPAMAADPNVQLANAAEAFKAFTSEEPIERPRDDKGRFAPTEGEQDLDEGELEPEAEDDVEQETDAEADDESQPEPVEMPTSWSKEDAELWQSLPAEAQGKIAEREAQREQAVNQKFQEAANARKENEAKLAEAQANRERFAQMTDVLLGAFQLHEPDPRAYGAGTGNYNREAYDLAVANWRENTQILGQLQAQRNDVAAQQAKEEQEAFQQWKASHDAEFTPKLLADVPDLQEPAKAEPVLRELVKFAIQSGIPEDAFTPENQNEVTAAQLHILWKAQQYDKIKGATAKVKETPAPKPASPSLKPGVAISRSATKTTAIRKANERLANEGSVEAGAAVWKNFLT